MAQLWPCRATCQRGVWISTKEGPLFVIATISRSILTRRFRFPQFINVAHSGDAMWGHNLIPYYMEHNQQPTSPSSMLLELSIRAVHNNMTKRSLSLTICLRRCLPCHCRRWSRRTVAQRRDVGIVFIGKWDGSYGHVEMIIIRYPVEKKQKKKPHINNDTPIPLQSTTHLRHHQGGHKDSYVALEPNVLAVMIMVHK